MSKSVTVMVTSAGRRHHLIETIRSDATELGLALTVIAVDVNPNLSAACMAADHHAAVPRCSSPDYIPSLLRVCTQHDVSVVIPTIDTELPMLAAARSSFSEMGVTVVISSPAAIRIARDKLLTAKALSDAGLPTPRTLRLTDALTDSEGIPGRVILKPVDGSNSVGLIRLESLQRALGLEIDSHQYVAQELCAGDEFTVNCFVNADGELLCAVPHRRLEVRGGEVSKALTERRPDLMDLAPKVASAMPGLRGPFCFQAIVGDRGPRIIEVNARFGGGYPVAHAAGAHFGRWILMEHLRRATTALPEWEDSLLMLRYDSAVFVHGHRS
ncbi:MAG: ATP-grasp domain-containing protein [Phycisphaerales bacterium]|nr:ATP-grasp domain-containing protein [Phycisphaerales bacterium]